ALVDRAGETGQIRIMVNDQGTDKTVNLPIQDFLKNQSQSALDVLGFLPYRPAMPAVIHQLSEDGAAIRQGMKVGDRILSINGLKMNDWFDV
ncbi:PDZ domain-containing protein, partial [Escherichia coli]|uniref:PDZ domain-containing protein n=2 Tax=Gammaproteobacteria TaxID=1236 RepID=UPI001EDAFFD5